MASCCCEIPVTITVSFGVILSARERSVDLQKLLDATEEQMRQAIAAGFDVAEELIERRTVLRRAIAAEQKTNGFQVCQVQC